MMYIWTNESIEKILLQLDNDHLPFAKYTFSGLGKGMKLLGKGGYAKVYAAGKRDTDEAEYAIKVIGFGSKHMEHADFVQETQLQKELSGPDSCIVKVLDSAEFRVWLDADDRVLKAEEVVDETAEAGDFIVLQFILMEKLRPILMPGKPGYPELCSELLRRGEPQELYKLSYDIGVGLREAHRHRLLHRDVKPENIFYDEKGKGYKLGDFGIAKLTEDGMASTIAFTKGYGAPEIVGALDDKYDVTADIYSYGMLLYVLYNGMKFPGSENYSVNAGEQYKEGYVLPRPKYASDEMYAFICKLCAYNPDERYQDMDEVMNALEGIILGKGVLYKQKHQKASLLTGIIFALAGTVIWQLTGPAVAERAPAMLYIIGVLCVGKCALYMRDKNTGFATAVLVLIGIGMYAAKSLSNPEAALLICGVLASGPLCALLAGIVIAAKVTEVLIGAGVIPMLPAEAYDYRWSSLLLISLSFFMLYQSVVLIMRSRNGIVQLMKRNIYWPLVAMFYFSQIYIWSIPMGDKWQEYIIFRRMSPETIETIRSFSPDKIVVAGFLFSMFWFFRELILNRMANTKTQLH